MNWSDTGHELNINFGIWTKVVLKFVSVCNGDTAKELTQHFIWYERQSSLFFKKKMAEKKQHLPTHEIPQILIFSVCTKNFLSYFLGPKTFSFSTILSHSEWLLIRRDHSFGNNAHNLPSLCQAHRHNKCTSPA